MKKLLIGKENTIVFGASDFTADGKNVSASIIDDTGETIVENVEAVFDTDHYKITFTISDTATPGYAGIYWKADSPVPDNYSPEYAEIVNEVPVGRQIIMPIEVFTGKFLESQAILDSSYKTVVDNYVNQNRDYIRQEIATAQGNVEQKLMMKIFPTDNNITRDFYHQDFKSEFWMIQTDFRPIIKINSYKLVYGAPQVSFDISTQLKDYMLIEPKMGIIEFLPTSVHGTLWMLLLTSIQALGISIMQSGGFSRIPALFRIEYAHGLWGYPDITEAQKESVRYAVGRNALINLLPRIDPLVRKTSESKSIDGASKSRSGGVADMIKTFREDEEKWCDELKREYGMHLNMAVA